MSMNAKLIKAAETGTGEPELRARITGAEDIAWFRQLVHNATNTWDSAPPQVREFADLVIHNEILQDYQGRYSAHANKTAPTKLFGADLI